MKHSFFVRILSVLLSGVLLFSCAGVTLAAQQGDADPSPVIYVIGRTNIYDDPSSPNRRQLAEASDEEIMEAVKAALPYAAKAVLFGQWDAYSDFTYDLLMKYFGGYCCDKNGEISDQSGPTFTWSENSISTNYRNDNPYTYRFEYDARRSPLEIADDLNEYIEAVKRRTGKDTVSIIGRCLGANIMMAWIQKYQETSDFAGLDSVVFYDSSFLGVEPLDAAMSGTVTFPTYAAGNFLTGVNFTVGNETLDKIIPMTLTMLRDTYGIDITVGFVENFYAHIKDTLIHRFLLSTFGSTPGYWSMVNTHYNEAMNYLFGSESDKYAGLIEKIEAYRNNVQLRGEELIDEMQAAGVEVAAVCKYGFSAYPLYEGSDRLSDGVSALESQSFGATCSTYTGTLEPAYIEEQTKAGLGAYIAPDKQVDASTGLLADTTWFIKNNEHNSFWNCIHPLLMNICRKENFTVTSDENWPQYLLLEDKYTVVPMTEENCDPTNTITHEGSDSGKNFFSAIRDFFRYLIALMKTLFSSMRAA